MPTIESGIVIGGGVTVTETPGVVSTGLQLYLDAGLSTSYSGSGTTWTDISGNGRNYSWASSPSWTSSGLGSYFQTGTSNYAAGPASNSFGLTTNYCVIIVCLQNTLTTNVAFNWDGTAGRGIYSHLSWVDGNIYWDQGGCCNPDTRTYVASGGTSQWTMWVYNKTSTTDRQIWKNITSLTTNTAVAADMGLNGNAALINANQNWDAKIGAVMLYSSGLTQAQIGQNYHYFKGRYGLGY